MSGWKDDNPDDERRETTRRNSTSVSQRTDGGGSGTDTGAQREAGLPDQSPGKEERSQGRASRQPRRPCKCKVEDQVVRRIVGLALGKYQGFNDHHLTDKLKEQESIDLSREKVRRVLRAEGIRSPKKRRGLKHR